MDRKASEYANEEYKKVIIMENTLNLITLKLSLEI